MVLATIIHNCAKYITNIIFKFTVAGATPKAKLSSPEKKFTAGAPCKTLSINNIGIFRVGIFATLKIPKQLSLSNLQVALHVSS